ncbi:MAG: hypothetical protein A2075_08815 [Geobacteraceae bacterium GWC2_58_44]|nr:MAG: hypothetical protein A2075_08815 [Geobacteraceae bacterium GWC2_58_44]
MDKKNILLVDDTRLFLEQETNFLSGYDFEVTVAQNGLQALKMINEEMPDMVFMDLYMPDMDGDRCCHMIKADESLRHIPVIMVTQGASDEDFKRCWQAGCDGIIAKPINRHFFLAMAKKHLNVNLRRSRRYEARLRIQYQGVDNAEKVLSDYSVNLSTGGIFIETTNLLLFDTPLKIEFTLPKDGKLIKCAGRVAWLNHPETIKNPNLPVGMGVQFTNLSLVDMDLIRDFIKSQSLRPEW